MFVELALTCVRCAQSRRNVHGWHDHALHRLTAIYIDVGLLDLATQTRLRAVRRTHLLHLLPGAHDVRATLS